MYCLAVPSVLLTCEGSALVQGCHLFSQEEVTHVACYFYCSYFQGNTVIPTYHRLEEVVATHTRKSKVDVYWLLFYSHVCGVRRVVAQHVRVARFRSTTVLQKS